MNDLRIEVSLGEEIELEEEGLLTLLERAVQAVLVAEAVDQAAISLTLVGDDQIANLNAQYLKHEGPTDVLSFPLFAQGEMPVGDIYVGYDQARRQAAELAVPLSTELARLAIHGTLHVLGYDHPEQDAREGSEMWQRQETILQQVLAR